jgi:hypothetical protein
MSGIEPVSYARCDGDFDGFAHDLGASFRRYGFAVICDHGLDQAVIDRALGSAKAFFALPDEVKRKWHVAGCGGARGYTPFGVETAKGRQHHDLKEFWHTGRDLPDSHPYQRYMLANLWPDEDVPGFRAHVAGLFEALDAMGARVLRAVARSLELPDGWFDDKVQLGNSVLRLLHYPPVSGESRRGGGAGGQGPRRLVAGGQPAGGRARLQHRRHAAAADQQRPSVHDPSGGEPRARAARPCALFDALLPALRAGVRHRDPAELHRQGPALPLPRPDHRRRLPAGAPAGDPADVIRNRTTAGSARGRRARRG